MHNRLAALARGTRFLPFVYNYCDLWCDRCAVSSRCLLHTVEQQDGGKRGRGGVAADIESGISFARAVLVAMGPQASAVAMLDVRLADPSTAPRTGHPLEWLARHYAMEANAFLTALGAGTVSPTVESALGVISWFQILIAAKIYRACISHCQAVDDMPGLRDDARGAAKVALIGIERSIEAFREVGKSMDEPRVGALVEILEALRIGVDLKFPGAREFIRPGLDTPGRGVPC
jgi:hypothetical protein